MVALKFNPRLELSFFQGNTEEYIELKSAAKFPREILKMSNIVVKSIIKR